MPSSPSSGCPVVDLIVGVAWPLVAGFGLLMFRAPVSGLVGRLRTFKLDKGKLSLEIEPALASSANEARNAAKMPDKPTAAELERGRKIAAAGLEWNEIRTAAIQLATEYDYVRATLPSGNERTKAMTGVIAKMRTMGAATFPYRYDFVDSASPGKRLLIIAALQVTPDIDLVGWLCDRVIKERPFIGFHAIGALRRSLSAPAGVHEMKEIKELIGEIEKNKDFKGDPGRESAFGILLDEVSRI